MNRNLLNILLISAVLLLTCGLGAASEAPKYVPVASYANKPPLNETVGNRIYEILRAKGIQSIAAGSAGITVSVPAERAAEALKAENLQLTLLVPKGDRYVIITPDSVLEPKNDK